MAFKLVMLNKCDLKEVYDMYQDIPKKELGSLNILKGLNYEQFKRVIESYILEQTKTNPELNTTTSRYLFYVNDEPIGELGIRTTLNEFWIAKGSQIFYKLRVSARNRGYGNKLLELGLKECKTLGFEEVRINCDDTNEKSKAIIIKNGGVLDIQSYKTPNGYSSSYIIKL